MPVPPNEAKNQERALELNSNMANRQPLGPPGAPPAALNNLVADNQATWSFSKEGGTGAILVTSDLEPSGGAAIKVEGKAAAAQVIKSAQMMESFIANAQGDCPINIPRVQQFSGRAAMGAGSPLAALKTKLETLHAAGDASAKKRISDQLDNLQGVANGNSSVLKMELAPGPTFNKLPQSDKMALLKSDQLGRTLGKALPTVVVLQQNDHLGVDGGGSAFKSNPTNLTFAPDTGQPSLIDLSSRMNYVGDDAAGNPLATLGQPDVAKVVRKLTDFQQKALESEQSFEQAVDDMVNGRKTPFKSMMDAFTKDTDGYSSMLNPEDKNTAVAELTMEDKRRFAANLIVGSVEGLEYPKQNMDALRTAVLDTHETLTVVDQKTRRPQQVEAEHFYTDAALQDLDDQFQSVDVDDLKQKAALRMTEFAVKQKAALDQRLTGLNEQAGRLQDQARELEKRIEKLEANKPGLQDRLKAAYRGKDNMLADLKGRLQTLQDQMADVQKESNSVMNTQAFNEAMQQQAAGPRQRTAVSVSPPGAHSPATASPSVAVSAPSSSSSVSVADSSSSSSIAVSSSSSLGGDPGSSQSSLRHSSSVGEMLRSSAAAVRSPSTTKAEVPVSEGMKAKSPAVAPGGQKAGNGTVVQGLVSQFEAVAVQNAPTPPLTPAPKKGRAIGG